MTLEQIRSVISEAIMPEKMSKRDAVAFLEELHADIDGQLDALREELDEDDVDADED